MISEVTVSSDTIGTNFIMLAEDTITIRWYYSGADVTSFIINWAFQDPEGGAFSSWWSLTSKSVTGGGAGWNTYTLTLKEGEGVGLPQRPGTVYKFQIQAMASGEIFDSRESNEIRTGGLANIFDNNQWKNATTYVFTNGSWYKARLFQVYRYNRWNNYG